MSRRLFSASRVLGSRLGSVGVGVGVGVAGCFGCAWVWNQRARFAAPSLALALPTGSSQFSAFCAAGEIAQEFGVPVAVRSFGGRFFLRVRGARSVLLSVARWWAGV